MYRGAEQVLAVSVHDRVGGRIGADGADERRWNGAFVDEQLLLLLLLLRGGGGGGGWMRGGRCLELQLVRLPLGHREGLGGWCGLGPGLDSCFRPLELEACTEWNHDHPCKCPYWSHTKLHCSGKATISLMSSFHI